MFGKKPVRWADQIQRRIWAWESSQTLVWQLWMLSH